MSERYLDLRDKARVIDFLLEHLEYASPKEQSTAQAWITDYQEGAKTPTDKLAEAARKFAIAIWPARFAVQRYFMTEGIEEEWKKITSSVRPSTAHLLKRFRQGTGMKSLDETLQHAESDTALHEGERIEIAEVRSHLRQETWKNKKKMLVELVKEGEELLKETRERFAALRELALVLPRSMQDEVFSKIERFEDRMYFEGEVIPLEILDQEVQYYKEQKAISPME